MEPFQSNVKVSKQGRNYILGIVISLIGFIVLPVVIQVIIRIILTKANPDGLALAISQINDVNAGTLTNYKDLSALAVILSMLPSVLGEIIALVAIIMIYHATFKDDLLRFKNAWKKDILIVIIGVVCVALANYLVGLLYTHLNLLGDSSNNILVKAAIYRYPYIMIPATIIIMPIFEEFIFRKCIFSLIIDNCKLNHWVAIILATLIFAASHATDVYFFYYLPLCFILAYSYDLSHRNIIVSGGIHICNNLISLLGMLL